MNPISRFVKNPDWAFFLEYLVLFSLLLVSIASIALLVIVTEVKPFLYANY